MPRPQVSSPSLNHAHALPHSRQVSEYCAEGRFTILIVDDAPASLNTLSELLAEDCNVLVARSGPAALKVARQHLPDLILLDVVMPQMNGHEVLRALREDPRTAEISVIFISGLDGPQHEALCLQMGGCDYITKPVNPEILVARVGVHLRSASKRRELEAIANLDALTGIANRRQFDVVMAAECRRAARSDLPLSVAMVDIDHFKLFNDCYGHVMGDEALRAVAQVLGSGARRPGDLVTRYGGEEFALILPGTDESQAVDLLESLNRSIAELAMPHKASPTGDCLTISVGIATQAPGDEADPEALLRRADLQLYRAKETGRNKVVSEYCPA